MILKSSDTVTYCAIERPRKTYQASIFLIQQFTVLIDYDLLPGLRKRGLPLDQGLHVGFFHRGAFGLLRHQVPLSAAGGRSNDIKPITAIPAANSVAEAVHGWCMAGIKYGPLRHCFSWAYSLLDSDCMAITTRHPLDQTAIVRGIIHLRYRTNDSIIGPSSDELGRNDARESECNR